MVDESILVEENNNLQEKDLNLGESLEEQKVRDFLKEVASFQNIDEDLKLKYENSKDSKPYSMKFLKKVELYCKGKIYYSKHRKTIQKKLKNSRKKWPKNPEKKVEKIIPKPNKIITRKKKKIRYFKLK